VDALRRVRCLLVRSVMIASPPLAVLMIAEADSGGADKVQIDLEAPNGMVRMHMLHCTLPYRLHSLSQSMSSVDPDNE